MKIKTLILCTILALGAACSKDKDGPGGGNGLNVAPQGEEFELFPGNLYEDLEFRWDESFSSREAGNYSQYKITMKANEEYTFEIATAEGAGGDTFLYLLDSSGNIVAQDDNGAGEHLSKLSYTSPETAVYYLRLRAFEAGTAGSCALRVSSEAGDPGDIPRIQAGDVLNDQIFEWRETMQLREEGRYGAYLIDIEASKEYVFETFSDDTENSDTYLYLLNSDGEIVAEADDGGLGALSYLSFITGESGTYTLLLRSFDKTISGRCQLKVSSPNQTPAGESDPLLPDLITLASDLSLMDAHVENDGNGKKLLRFSTSVANRGDGPLRIYGAVNSEVGKMEAFQLVENADGTRTTYQVGTLEFRDNQWQFESFARYQLQNADTGAMVKTAGKTSFCLMDHTIHNPDNLPNARPTPLFSCENQGISVGWSDVYSSALLGQSFDISDLPDGTYKLISTADPSGLLHELNKDNNAAEVTLQITGDDVSVVDGGPSDDGGDDEAPAETE